MTTPGFQYDIIKSEKDDDILTHCGLVMSYDGKDLD